ncbi:MAG: helix-turn-helix transcriptional regulator [Paracoccaceae bacterium]|nr:helix-turn-helix transcriptional regulator [Paracoccaceae bacterium]
MKDTENLLLESFSEVLREKRKKLGLSQEELAFRAGVSMRYISLLEGRKYQPSLATIQGVCKGLNITISQLFVDIETHLSSK